MIPAYSYHCLADNPLTEYIRYIHNSKKRKEERRRIEKKEEFSL
jgi:hypothetical protein